MSAHTKGPWSVTLYTNYEGFSIQSDAEPMYGCIAERWEDTGRDEAREARRKANARLIAAAPELLEELISTEDELVSSGLNGFAQRIASLRAIFAKATGEESA